jgi:rhodanese-related sulfurtransferase
MAKRFLTAFAILLVNALFIYSYVSPGDCSTKSVSVESALQKLKEKQDFILVDVRNPNEFEKFRIPSSVNIPLFALKTKTFFKSKPLVLVNEGHGYKQLTEECAILSEAGFSVSVLDGGLYQWRRKGGPLEGDVFAQRELNEISAQTFFAAKAYENWMVIDVSKSGKTEPDIGNKDVRRTHIPFGSDSKEFISKLKSATKNHSEKEFASVIICDEKGRIYEEIERQIQIAGMQNVLYLKGGLEAYKTFEKQQISMGQEKKVRTGKSNRGCTTCP